MGYLATGAAFRKINLDFATAKTVNKGRSWIRGVQENCTAL